MTNSNGSSWMALLATTLGVAGAESVHAEVRADLEGLDEDQKFRLIVQTYDAKDGNPPRAGARPIGSTQRSVTVGDLRRGLTVSLLEVQAQAPSSSQPPVVVAWIDDGEVDHEFDGRRARPLPGCIYGFARRRNGGSTRVAIDLKRRVA